MDLNGIGIWSGELRHGDDAEKREAVAELEELGYTAAWIPDVGGDVFGALRDLLESTTTLVAATGILNLWMHSAAHVGEGFAALEADFAGRTLLGIGVSMEHGAGGRFVECVAVLTPINHPLADLAACRGRGGLQIGGVAC